MLIAPDAIRGLEMIRLATLKVACPVRIERIKSLENSTFDPYRTGPLRGRFTILPIQPGLHPGLFKFNRFAVFIIENSLVKIFSVGY